MSDTALKGSQVLPPLILVADDIASLRLLYSTLLVGEGYRVVEARDGIEALERIRNDHPAMAILDISMPRMDGMQVLEALRKAGNKTPVLVITAHKERETVLAAAQRGVVSYLTKPINIADFRDRVRHTLMEHGALKPGAPAHVGPAAQGPTASPDAVLDPDSQKWLASAPTGGWDLARLDEFLQAGEDLGAIVASIALAADAAVPHDPSRAERVAQLPPGLALAKLQAAFQRGDPQVRATLVDLLPGSLPEPQRLQALSQWLGDPHPQVRLRVAGTLAALKSPGGIHALLPLLRDANEEVRGRMMGILQEYGWLKALDLLVEHQAASEEPLPEPVCEQLRGLTPPHVLDHLRGLLRDGGSEVRASAVRLAPRLGWPEARRMAESALADPDTLVRAAAVEGLCQAGDRKAAGLLFDLITDPDPGVLQALCRSAAAASFRPETHRIIQQAARLDVEARAALPALLTRLEATTDPLPAVLADMLRSGEADRGPVMKLAAGLGFQEVLPPGPLGPIVAKAFADYLAELLLREGEDRSR